MNRAKAYPPFLLPVRMCKHVRKVPVERGLLRHGSESCLPLHAADEPPRVLEKVIFRDLSGTLDLSASICTRVCQIRTQTLEQHTCLFL